MAVATYAEVAEAVFGPPGRLAIEAAVVLLELMFAVGFVIVGIRNTCLLSGLSRIVVAAAAAPILGALSIFRFLNKFWGVSAFGLLVYLGGVMGVASYHAIAALTSSPSSSNCSLNETLTSNCTEHGSIDRGTDISVGGVILFWSTSLYSMEGICMVLPISNSLRDPDNHAEPMVLYGVMAYAVLTVLYGAISFAGGLGACPPGESTCIITDVLPAGGLTDTVRATLVVGLVVSHPLCIYPCAELIEPRLVGDGNELTSMRRILLKWVLVLVTLVLGYSVESFDTFASFGGSLLLPLVAFVAPPAMYLKVNNEQRAAGIKQVGPPWMRPLCYASVALGFFMLVAGMISAVLAVRGEQDGGSSNNRNHTASSWP